MKPQSTLESPPAKLYPSDDDGPAHVWLECDYLDLDDAKRLRDWLVRAIAWMECPPS